MTPRELANLLHSCAQAMNAEEQRRVDAEGLHWRGICGEWTSKGQEICTKIAGPVWGDVCYYMLGGAWNDVLDWADRQQQTGKTS